MIDKDNFIEKFKSILHSFDDEFITNWFANDAEQDKLHALLKGESIAIEQQSICLNLNIKIENFSQDFDTNNVYHQAA